MKKNPLATIDAYDTISKIILHGKMYSRNEFRANAKIPNAY
jgi:hypothetical protein